MSEIKDRCMSPRCEYTARQQVSIQKSQKESTKSDEYRSIKICYALLAATRAGGEEVGTSDVLEWCGFQDLGGRRST
jgi:hypothetical protein